MSAELTPSIPQRSPLVFFGAGVSGRALLLQEWESLGARAVQNRSEQTLADVLWLGANDTVHPSQRDQRVNRIPGMELLSRKESLVTAAQRAAWDFVPCVMDGCALDDDSPKPFSWVAKGRHHRDVHVLHHLPPTQAERDQLVSRSLVQRRVANPLLIGGRAFDLGVYALVSERREGGLEFWLYEDVLLRFCTAPFTTEQAAKELLARDPDLVQRSWIVSDNYTGAWEVPELMYGEFGTRCRDALAHSLPPEVVSLQRVWDRINTMVARTLGAVEAVRTRAPAPEVRGGAFELVRYDFVLDSVGLPWLLEVNSGPNMQPSSEGQAAMLRSLARFIWGRLATHHAPGGLAREAVVRAGVGWG